MYVYVFIIFFEDDRWEIANVFTTEAQAKDACQRNMRGTGSTWGRYAITGFPWIAFSALVLLACFGALILTRVLFG
jgi:hypothetical protein